MQAKAGSRQRGPAQGELGAGGAQSREQVEEQGEAGSRGSWEQVEAGSRGGWEQGRLGAGGSGGAQCRQSWEQLPGSLRELGCWSGTELEGVQR